MRFTDSPTSPLSRPPAFLSFPQAPALLPRHPGPSLRPPLPAPSFWSQCRVTRGDLLRGNAMHGMILTRRSNRATPIP